MSTVEEFELEWKRLLKVSRKAADAYRREHNRRVMWEHKTYGDFWIWDDADTHHVWGEQVSHMENGKATAKRVTLE